jgi:hypothetical protein
MEEKGMRKLKNKKDIALPVILPVSYRIETSGECDVFSWYSYRVTQFLFILRTTSGSLPLRHPFSLSTLCSAVTTDPLTDIRESIVE